jgi:hypothetical protein
MRYTFLLMVYHLCVLLIAKLPCRFVIMCFDLKRLADIGAFVTTSDSLFFQMIEGADHPSFKAISKIAANSERPDPGLN